MPSSLWLVITGIFAGLITRRMFVDAAYGAVADALLGITGAFAADWAIGPSEMAWNSKALLTIWGAISLPCLAHLFARRHKLTVSRRMGRR